MQRETPTKVSVAVYFEEPAINMLFADLLRSKGVKAMVLNNIEEIPANARLITEPQFLDEVPSRLRNSCLVVANSNDSVDFGKMLKRPLTERKVELAISDFLS